jgi:hypothetical protein
VRRLVCRRCSGVTRSDAQGSDERVQ